MLEIDSGSIFATFVSIVSILDSIVLMLSFKPPLIVSSLEYARFKAKISKAKENVIAGHDIPAEANI